MEIVTGLPGIKFSDQFELVPFQKPTLIQPKSINLNLRTTTLLKKFRDPKNIPDSETWNTVRVPGNSKDAIRILN